MAMSIRVETYQNWTPVVSEVPEMITVIGVAFEYVRIKAKRNSFHVNANMMIPALTKAGATNGNAIRVNDWNGEHPSTWAASSNSMGSSLNASRKIRTAKGM